MRPSVLMIYSQSAQGAIMNIYEEQVVVDDAEGKKYICTLDHKKNDFLYGPNRDRKTPHKLEELSKHERKSCTSFFFGKTVG